MATCRTYLGLRRRGSRLIAGLLLALTACAGARVDTEARLANHRRNASEFLSRGAYPQAIHQADKALQLDPDSVPDQLVKATALFRLGRARDRVDLLDASLLIFEQLVKEHDPEELSDAWVGAGSARFALALAHDHQIARLERRIEDPNATPQERQADQAQLEEERQARLAMLQGAEVALRAVLSLEGQKDHRDALVELFLVLISLPGREEEALQIGPRALELISESTRYTRSLLDKGLSLAPDRRLRHQARIDHNLEREQLMRDAMATIRYNRGDLEGSLEELAILEERQLMGEIQYFNRAQIFEELGRYEEAVADLEHFLRLRSRHLDYQEDDMAPAVFARLEDLRARSARSSRR